MIKTRNIETNTATLTTGHSYGAADMVSGCCLTRADDTLTPISPYNSK